jgi:hypothetical protein
MTVMQRLQDHILISLLNEKGERLAAQLSISPADILNSGGGGVHGAATPSKPTIYHNIESVPVTGGQVQRVKLQTTIGPCRQY